MRFLALLLCFTAIPAPAISCRLALRAWLAQEAAHEGPSLTSPKLPVLVMGAGPAGLAALRALQDRGIAAIGVERHSGVGGMWDTQNPGSPAYASLTTLGSLASQHLGDPWPEGTPNFVSHGQALEYLRAFAERHALIRQIRFQTEVLSVDKSPQETWLVQSRGPAGEVQTQEYRAVIVATGRHHRSHAHVPEDLRQALESIGRPFIHSADYRTPEPYRGKRVLIIGLGNSAADIATEISAVTASTVVSVRSSPWIVPLTVLGKPAEEIGNAGPDWVPHALEIAVFNLIRRATVAHPTTLGLPAPDHELLQKLPIADRGFVRAVKSGHIVLKTNVAPDASFDAIILATGYRQAFPFLGDRFGNVADPDSPIPFLIFHPREPGLCFMNEVVVPQSTWSIFPTQADALAAYFQAETDRPERARDFNRRRAIPNPNFKGSLFSRENGLHVKPSDYVIPLGDLTAWFSN